MATGVQRARLYTVGPPSDLYERFDTALTREEFDEILRFAPSQEVELARALSPRLQPTQKVQSALTSVPSSEHDQSDGPLENPVPLHQGRSEHDVRTSIDSFIQNHPFVQRDPFERPTVSARRRFTRDVYDFARAKGLGSVRAEGEVKQARAFYRRHRRVGKVSQWIEEAQLRGSSAEEELSRIREDNGWNTDQLEGNFSQSDASATDLGSEAEDNGPRRDILFEATPSRNRKRRRRARESLSPDQEQVGSPKLNGSTSVIPISAPPPAVSIDSVELEPVEASKASVLSRVVPSSTFTGDTEALTTSDKLSRRVRRKIARDKKTEQEQRNPSSLGSPAERLVEIPASDASGLNIGSNSDKGEPSASGEADHPEPALRQGASYRRKMRRKRKSTKEAAARRSLLPDGGSEVEQHVGIQRPDAGDQSVGANNTPETLAKCLVHSSEGTAAEEREVLRENASNSVVKSESPAALQTDAIPTSKSQVQDQVGDSVAPDVNLSSLSLKGQNQARTQEVPGTSPAGVPRTPPTKQSSEAEPDHKQTRRSRKRTTLRSPFFKAQTESDASPKVRRSATEAVSCIPFPPLSQPSFGLIQERLAHDPFKLLIGVTFLNRTRGIHAIPVFYQLMERYPTPDSLAAADVGEVAATIRHLGLQNTRARRYIQLAEIWLQDPPRKGRRHRKLNYPSLGDGKQIKPREIVDDEDERSGAWEVAHLPTAGPYAIDSWRIFCRDELRGEATDWTGSGRHGQPDGFEPEWKRVIPQDKELRAYLRWMWLKEGWEWDPRTGRKERASEELLERGREGTIIWEEHEQSLDDVEDLEVDDSHIDNFQDLKPEGAVTAAES
ncbi:MAG: hypothetical protein M4579_005632 [Chaenotheca gracillima]|nr:MAG: hypothetical protein M4579_005632 [Chaenotheca gracillima]